jgi:light-regulated signal transduction histidine kinase (bacteriophytochrome)
MSIEEIKLSKSELARQKAEIEKLATELLEANRRLTLQNEEKEKRAVELIMINKELKRAKEQLESSNRELEAFSYSVAHDLRAPLRGVGSYSQMLQEDYAEALDDNGRRLLGNIQKSADKMGMLIDDLLSLSRLGKTEMRLANVDMADAVRRVLEEYREAGTYQSEIITQPLPMAKADPSLLHHMLVNLIGNALKYSAKTEHPRIEISAREEKGEVIYSIADNGVGFDMKYAHKLFGVFQRLHTNKEFEGTGVGLATVKRIIDRHGGRIWADAEVGRGATFYFALQAAK